MHSHVAADERRLQHVGRVHRRTERASLADEVVQFVDEQDQVRVGRERAHQTPHPLFVLPPECRPGKEGDMVERHDPGVSQRRRDLSGRDALREAFCDRRLADAGLTNERGVVLGLAEQNVDDPGDLGVPTPHRLEHASTGLRGEVRTHLFQDVARALCIHHASCPGGTGRTTRAARPQTRTSRAHPSPGTPQKARPDAFG